MIYSGISIEEGSTYWIGHQPRKVRVLRLIPPGDFGGRATRPIVEYEDSSAAFPKPEDNGLHKTDIAIFASLASQGTKGRLKTYQSYRTTLANLPPEDPELERADRHIAELEGVLNGMPGPKSPREDDARLTVYVKPASHVDPALDLWSLIDSLTGGCCNGRETGTGVYDCTVFGRSGLPSILNDPNLELVRIVWGEGDKAVDVTDWAHPKDEPSKCHEMVAVACRDASGWPAMPVFEVDVTEAERNDGRHYELAELLAEEGGYEGPFVCFDSSEHSIIAQAAGRAAESIAQDLTEDRIASYYDDKIGDCVIPLETIPDLLAKLTIGNPGALAELHAKMIEDGDLDDPTARPQEPSTTSRPLAPKG